MPSNFSGFFKCVTGTEGTIGVTRITGMCTIEGVCTRVAYVVVGCPTDMIQMQSIQTAKYVNFPTITFPIDTCPVGTRITIG